MPYTAIFTSANPRDDLVYVQQEFQRINEHFSELTATGTINAVINSDATEKAIFGAYLSQADIRLFHFSGHSGNGELFMADGKLSEGNILASIVRYAKHLHLVFLNGCGTNDLVDKFLEYGARLVIATNSPVFDLLACNFSDQFYKMLTSGKTIRQSFEAARAEIKEELKNRINQLKAQGNRELNEHCSMLSEFADSDAYRTIGKVRGENLNTFQWAVYHEDGLNTDQLKKYEDWTLEDYSFASPVIDHIEPSFDLLTTIAKIISEEKQKLLPLDPRLESMQTIETLLKDCQGWGDANVVQLINKLCDESLLTPLKAPFKSLMIASKDKASRLLNSSRDDFMEILRIQMTFYKSFIRTVAIIMLSDFVESIVFVAFKGNQELKEIFKSSFSSEDDSLRNLFEALIKGEKTLEDIEFTIKLMRSVVPFLANGRSKLSREDKFKTAFQQFIAQYNGNSSGTTLDMALIDSRHQVCLTIFKKVLEGQIERAPVELLKNYCDKIESALIELFEDNKYFLLYEMITVGKVEVNKSRVVQLRTIKHQVFTHLGSISTAEIDFGGDFTENYSVLLVPHRMSYLNNLSLSPFVINIGPFFDQDKIKHYYFTGKKKYEENNQPSTKILYLDPDDDEAIEIDIVNEPDGQALLKDSKFLTMTTTAIEVTKLRKTESARALTRFARVRDQLIKIEELYYQLVK